MARVGNAALMRFLDKSSRTPFVWGTNDCLLDVADWVDAATGSREAENWRGHYASEGECYALLSGMGGLVAAVSGAALRLGLAVTETPEPGDVGLVKLPEPMGAIMMPSRRWRMRTVAGFVTTAKVELVIAWSVPCRR